MIIPIVLGPNATVPVSGKGTGWFIYTSPVPLNVRATGLDSFSQYAQQTGVEYGTKFFTQLEVQNTQNYTVAAQIFINENGELDDRRILPSPAQPFIINQPTFTAAGANYVAQIPDLSGQTFKDPQGNSWVAVQRNALIFQAIKAAVTQANHAVTLPATDGQQFNIPDLSGGTFQDPSGTTWTAVSRASINITLIDTSKGGASGSLYYPTTATRIAFVNYPTFSQTVTGQAGTIIAQLFNGTLPIVQTFTITETYNVTAMGAAVATGIYVYSGLTLNRFLEFNPIASLGASTLNVAGNLSAYADGSPGYFSCFELYQAIPPYIPIN